MSKLDLAIHLDEFLRCPGLVKKLEGRRKKKKKKKVFDHLTSRVISGTVCLKRVTGSSVIGEVKG